MCSFTKGGRTSQTPTRYSLPARSATRPAPGAQRTRARLPSRLSLQAPAQHPSCVTQPPKHFFNTKAPPSTRSAGPEHLRGHRELCAADRSARGARQHDRGRQRRHVAQALAPAQRAAWQTRPTAALARHSSVCMNTRPTPQAHCGSTQKGFLTARVQPPAGRTASPGSTERPG